MCSLKKKMTWKLKSNAQTRQTERERAIDRRGNEKITERQRNTYLFDMPSPRLSQNRSVWESSRGKNESI